MTLFNTVEEPQGTLRPVCALLLHEERSRAFYGSRSIVLTTHELHETETGPLIGSGRMLGAEDQRTIADLLLGADDGPEEAYLPPEVLSVSSTRLAWMVPAHVRSMYVRLNNKTECLRVPWPTLLFRVIKGTLAIAAVRGTRRPHPKTGLSHAPLMNIFANTNVCTGSAQLPTSWRLVDRAGYEAVIFATNFSHVNHSRTL